MPLHQSLGLRALIAPELLTATPSVARRAKLTIRRSKSRLKQQKKAGQNHYTGTWHGHKPMDMACILSRQSSVLSSTGTWHAILFANPQLSSTGTWHAILFANPQCHVPELNLFGMGSCHVPELDTQPAGPQPPGPQPAGPQPAGRAARCSDKGFLAMSCPEYLELLDWSARQVAEGKPGRTPGHLPPILLRLGLAPTVWLELVCNFDDLFSTIAGLPEHIDQECGRQTGRPFHVNQRTRDLFAQAV